MRRLRCALLRELVVAEDRTAWAGNFGYAGMSTQDSWMNAYLDGRGSVDFYRNARSSNLVLQWGRLEPSMDTYDMSPLETAVSNAAAYAALH
eukprot:4079120-Prymnesium_polylepis.1